MGRLWLAVRTFFRVLFDGETAGRVRDALSGRAALPAPAAAIPATAAEPVPKPPAKPNRSEALTLLATLQREGRLVDFLKEPIDGYTDEQIGAAVRSIHRDCAAVLDRLFSVRPVVGEPEGAAVSVPDKADAGRYRLTGKVTDRPHGTGRLVHHGWAAGRCELPQWTGGDASASVIAPAEVELQ